MNGRTFVSPVFVKSGTHFIQEILSLDDALDFIEDWPVNRRGPIYETALRACHRAYIGDVPLDVARSAFVGFAKSAGILQDVAQGLPFQMPHKSGRGGVSA
jgi:hypothetical protein